jgi:hypothetical protein
MERTLAAIVVSGLQHTDFQLTEDGHTGPDPLAAPVCLLDTFANPGNAVESGTEVVGVQKETGH